MCQAVLNVNFYNRGRAVMPAIAKDAGMKIHVVFSFEEAEMHIKTPHSVTMCLIVVASWIFVCWKMK